MKTTEVTLTLAELQEALLDYAFKHAKAQPDVVVVTGFRDKPLLVVPLKPGTVVEGKDFRQQT
jgi:hypothetical protein